MARIIEVIPTLDPTLEGAARSTLGRMQHDLQTLQGKIIQAAKRRHDTLRRQFMHARALAFPSGHALILTDAVLSSFCVAPDASALDDAVAAGLLYQITIPSTSGRATELDDWRAKRRKSSSNRAAMSLISKFARA